MITPKNPQKSRSAKIAHMNDLLDEALTETFPASDPIAMALRGDGSSFTGSRRGKRDVADQRLGPLDD